VKTQKIVPYVVGLVVIAAAVAGVFYMQRGAHLELPGRILKVRTVAVDETSSIAVLDFRTTNPSDYPIEVRDVTILLDEPNGNRFVAAAVPGPDTQRVFAGLPVLGPQYNPVLTPRSQIAPHSESDHMIMARFEAPQARLDARRRFVIRVEEVNHAVFEISGK
jgi:hypothetical protein